MLAKPFAPSFLCAFFTISSLAMGAEQSSDDGEMPEAKEILAIDRTDYFRIGLSLTVIILLLAGSYAFVEWDALYKMKPNEFGDFLAGIFGPLVLLWVVMGFLQQGAELKYSREALLLQAKELKASVNAQNNMGAAAWEQVKVGRDAQAAQTESAIRSVAPILFVESAGGGSSGGLKYTQINIRNSGGAAFKVTIEVSDKALVLDSPTISTLPGDSHHTLKLTSNFDYPIKEDTLTVQCNDKLGLAHRYQYKLSSDGVMFTISNSFGDAAAP